MFLRKSKQLKVSQKKSNLDHALWFVKNYLPQKKGQGSRKEFSLNYLEKDNINQIQKFASLPFKSLTTNLSNKKVSLTFGSWALPYFKLLRLLGIGN